MVEVFRLGDHEDSSLFFFSGECSGVEGGGGDCDGACMRIATTMMVTTTTTKTTTVLCFSFFNIVIGRPSVLSSGFDTCAFYLV